MGIVVGTVVVASMIIVAVAAIGVLTERCPRSRQQCQSQHRNLKSLHSVLLRIQWGRTRANEQHYPESARLAPRIASNSSVENSPYCFRIARTKSLFASM